VQTLELAAIATIGTVVWFTALALVVGALKRFFGNDASGAASTPCSAACSSRSG
jgi:Flp pilus assembly pilin Flp